MIMTTLGVAGTAHASDKPAPAKAPTSTIVNIQLEDPLTGDSKCYLDLDTGKTFTSAQTPQGYPQFLDWLAQSGADVMCETREPAKGLVAHNMAVLEVAETIDTSRDRAAIQARLQTVERQQLNFISSGAQLPATYFYSTREGGIGVLEITEKTDNPDGLRLRYKLLLPPPRPLNVGKTSVRADPADALATQIQWHKRRLEILRKKYLPQHPVIVRLEVAIRAMEEKLATMRAAPTTNATGPTKRPSDNAAHD